MQSSGTVVSRRAAMLGIREGFACTIVIPDSPSGLTDTFVDNNDREDDDGPEPTTPMVPTSIPSSSTFAVDDSAMAGLRRPSFTASAPPRSAKAPSSAFGGGDGGGSGPTRILPLLYLGSYADVKDAAGLRRLGVRKVLNVAADCAEDAEPGGYAVPDGVEVRHVLLRDRSDEDIGPHFASCTDFILDATSAGECVLVHCRKGISRSAAIVIAFLMITERMTYEAALQRVKRLRPCVSPNIGFVVALGELEDRLRGETQR